MHMLALAHVMHVLASGTTTIHILNLGGLIFGHAIDATARQPEARSLITPTMWIGFALTEALALIGIAMFYVLK